MSRRHRRIGGLGVAIAAGAFAIAAAWQVAAADKPVRAGGKSPRIVRVERPRLYGGRSPRVCNVFPQSDMSTMCWGPPVEVGEEAAVLGSNGVVGRVRVREVTAPDCASGTNYWSFRYDVISGNLTDATSMLNALFDLEVRSDTGRSLDTVGITAPSSNSAENVWTAFDRDADTLEDLIVTAYSCDADGFVLDPSASMSGSPFCMDYWLRDAHAWRRARQDIIDRCY
jgi:hypothetical protein